LYLLIQSIFILGLLLLWDPGLLAGGLQARSRRKDIKERDDVEEEVSNELTRVESSQEGLRVLHFTKQFNDHLAVDAVTFGVRRGEALHYSDQAAQANLQGSL
jgi:ATP-binding cassette, subfamily A (ABC1), member 3